MCESVSTLLLAKGIRAATGSRTGDIVAADSFQFRPEGGWIRAEGCLPIQVRVRVNTGDVVVRSIKTGQTHGEYAPIGHSASLAAVPNRSGGLGGGYFFLQKVRR
jgi:hypothetical protein